MCSGPEAGSNLRLIDLWRAHLVLLELGQLGLGEGRLRARVLEHLHQLRPRLERGVATFLI